MNIKDIKEVHVQDAFNEIKHYSKSTLKLILSRLKSIFQCAVDNDYLAKNPVKNITLQSTADKEKRGFLSVKEQKLFLKYASKYKLYPLFVFILYTGCRVGEATALEWQDIDIINKVITINKSHDYRYNRFSKTMEHCISPGKTENSNRKIPIHPVLEQLLISLPRSNVTNLVFFNRNNTYYSKQQINTSINNIVKKINANERHKIKRISAHSLRHSFASACIASDISPKVVQEYLGHSDIQTTMNIYVHNTDETKKKEINKLAKIL